MDSKTFLYNLGSGVQLVASGEVGRVIGRAEYEGNESNYLVRYKAADGRQVEQWWGESAVVGVAV